mmetsp:Transcript_20804/g.32088  ORF Transcript_20804/g.32088 Transcript_20804/m.32088 type:complete len:222 (+) Transcript_20804:34-699(+)
MPKKRERGHKAKSLINQFVSKKPKLTQKENPHVTFKGFYARLKSLDVKQSHNMDLPQNFDRFVGTQTTTGGFESRLHDEDMTESNFIEYLRVEKMNNRTVDFKVVFNELEQLAYSHALIVVNKKQIIEKLIYYLRGRETPESDSEEQDSDADIEQFLYQTDEQPAPKEDDTTTSFVVKGKVLNLIIALIKDLRHEMYTEFKELILPEVIQLIDVQNLELLD